MNMIQTHYRSKYDIFFIVTLLFSLLLSLQVPFIFYFFGNFVYVLLVLFRFSLDQKVKVNTILFTSVFTLTLLFNMFLQYYFLPYGESILILSMRNIFLTFLCLLMFDYIQKINTLDIDIALQIITYIFSIPIIIQFILVYILNFSPSTVDLSLLLGGLPSRSYSNYFELFNFRPTGLTSEPAIAVYVLTFCLSLLVLNDKDRNISFYILPLLAMVLTLSSLGLVISIAFFIIIFLRKSTGILLALAIVPISFSFVYDLVLQRISFTSTGSDTSNSSKMEVIKYFLSDPTITFFGYSYPVIDKDNTPLYFEALGDLTIVFTTIGRFGIIFGLLYISSLFIYLYKLKLTLTEILVISLALIKLTGINTPSFIVFIAIVTCIKKQQLSPLNKELKK